MNESDNANGDNPPPTPTDAPNVVALSGQSQTVPIGFNADVRGTAAAETLQVLSKTNVTFGGNDGDEIEFEQPISAYTISASGNGISVSNGETKASLSLNGAVDLAFADGSATAQIRPTDAGFGVFLGEQRVGDTFDPGAVTLDTSDVSAIADEEGSDSGGTFPDLPSEGGPQPVSAGTGASENINGNQNATISGNGGDDRYILQTDSNAELTIDDFENGDQLFFTVDQLNDINVNNDVFGDGRVTLSAGQAAVTLTNLTESADQQIFDNASFEEQFGDRGIGISGDGGEDTGFPALPSEGGPQPVSAGTGASENLDGNQDTTISGNGGKTASSLIPRRTPH
ncbi:hypothetical protein SAMN05216241_1118 [Limimonas halophila]|uniref:Uncharacterized protein n=1 Tax=Limimonas halophila TaxID=1082479 RepID=A0A1G7TZG2_9PROT|nr:hypothetical protein [Limimonas halophila]SDG40471.1 hypothetical protein SAMN05216241_1118 [Limimonas halophila]